MKSQPLRQKLIRQFTLQAGFVILLASALFTINDVRILRFQMYDKLVTASEVVSVNLASSLEFFDQDSAIKSLNSFEAAPMVSNAFLFNLDGNLFATYGDVTGIDARALFLQATSIGEKVSSSGNTSKITIPVRTLDNERVGTLIVLSQVNFLTKILSQYSTIFLAVFGISVATIFLLARNLSRQITGQLTGLVETAKRITTEGDFSVRASDQTSSQIKEIDEMAHEFDVMLQHVKDRESLLTHARDGLEIKVQERTTLLEVQQFVTAAANDAETFVAALGVAVEQLCLHTGWDCGVAHLINSTGQQILPTDIRFEVGSKGLVEAIAPPEEGYLTSGNNLAAQCTQANGPVLTQNYPAESWCFHQETAAKAGIRAALAFPVSTENDMHAVIELFSTGDRAPDLDYFRMLSLISAQLGRVVERQNNLFKVEESERTLRQVMDAVPHQIFAKDQTGKFILANKATADLLGMPVNDLIGMTDKDLGRPTEECERAKIENQTVLSTNKPLTISLLDVVNSKGELLKFQVTKIPFMPAGSFEMAVLGIAIDITERVNAENESRQIEDQMRHTQKLESLGVLAGGIAHDFNNLLMVILGHTELAMSRDDLSEPLQKNLSQINQASKRAADLTNQMLAYSGKGKFVVQQVELDQLIIEMMDLLKSVINKSAHLSIRTKAQNTLVKGDPSQLNQVAMNLITNASDSLNEASGTINISIGNCHGHEIDMTNGHTFGDVVADKPYVSFSVEDSGVGMDADTLDRIFEPFFTTKFVGRGLGLAAVIGIVRGHNGILTVESQVGQGSIFRVFIPQITQDTAPTPKNQLPTPGETARGTILIIDDELDVLSVASDILSTAGFNVLTADSGQMGTQMFSDKRDDIDIVLLDMSMPDLNGPQTFEMLRKLDPKVRVLFCSGFNEDVAREHFTFTDRGHFIQKPYGVKQLISEISTVLQS